METIYVLVSVVHGYNMQTTNIFASSEYSKVMVKAMSLNGGNEDVVHGTFKEVKEGNHGNAFLWIQEFNN